MTIYNYISVVHEMNSLSKLDSFDPNDKELFDRRFMSVHTWRFEGDFPYKIVEWIPFLELINWLGAWGWRFVNTVDDSHIFEYAFIEETEPEALPPDQEENE